MSYKTIDMETYKRRDHFAYFSSMAYPYVGLTANVDITVLLEKVKAERLPFFLTASYCAAQAANGVPEFRQRILDGKIIEFDRCPVSHTVALEDGTFCFCALEDVPELYGYLAAGRAAQEAAKQRASIREDAAEVLDKFFISSIPWVSYTALVQPVPSPADSNPRITFGKYFPQNGQVLLPVSVLCHHALVDGLHLAAFYENLNTEIEKIGQNKVLP